MLIYFKKPKKLTFRARLTNNKITKILSTVIRLKDTFDGLFSAHCMDNISAFCITISKLQDTKKTDKERIRIDKPDDISKYDNL